ncbi:MAG TPA: hypothetical protein VF138_00815 [Caulobacteraceae bacterium]
MNKLIAVTALAVLFSTPALAAKAPELTPMQLQAIQQKEFDAQKEDVFSSVVDVFQDLGYTINSADLNTGFITAESATVNKTSFWEAVASAQSAGNTRATAYIQSMPSGMTKVRLNFVSTKTISMQYGQGSRQDKPIIDAAVYQRAFEKVDEALFVRKATNAPAPAPAPASDAEPVTTPAASQAAPTAAPPTGS